MIETTDASALLAFLQDEPGADIVAQLLLDPDTACVAHVVNLCEVFYSYYRAGAETAAQEALSRLQKVGLLPRDDLDDAFWQEAGRLKAVHRRVSLADCFCVTLARRVGGEVVTADHHEFDALVPLNLCPIRFIR